jgi:hypothetical protein
MTFILSKEEKKDYDWICKVMKSCTTLEQSGNAFALVSLFYIKYNNLTMAKALINLSTEVDIKIELNETTN